MFRTGENKFIPGYGLRVFPEFHVISDCIMFLPGSWWRNAVRSSTHAYFYHTEVSGFHERVRYYLHAVSRVSQGPQLCESARADRVRVNVYGGGRSVSSANRTLELQKPHISQQPPRCFHSSTHPKSLCCCRAGGAFVICTTERSGHFRRMCLTTSQASVQASVRVLDCPTIRNL